MRKKARAKRDLLEQYESPLTADFRRFYQLRLMDAVLGMDWDEFLALINWLPPESAFVACAQAKGDATQGRKLMGWTATEDLLQYLSNLVNYQTYAIRATAGDTKVKPPKPIENPRGQTPSRGPGGDASAMARALMAQQRG